ncbi:hypothetical protein KIH39_24100 [Telmatocola sphagniphila]|uniref:AMIN domain-containing protein n=1 Tax=Telmatocola sphagniphila TaxID=1123043 RepID=A0A8E6EXQ8_9BACT|nr:hypothetical protein [Telmatocola sphagniphila]QVL31883.1 hypothetical protein KIH39_24100 [Telmatocola sphagniphila]
MIRSATPIRFGLLVVVLSLAAQPVLAQEKVDTDKIMLAIKDLEKSLTEQKNKQDNSNLNLLSDISALKLRLDKLETALSAPPKNTDTSKKIDTSKLDSVANEDLKKQIEDLRKENLELKERLRTQSKRIDTTNVAKPGKIRFVNQYPTEMTIVVNSRRIDLSPFQDITVTVPAGSFNYQVLQVQEFMQTRTVSENETFEVNIK